MSYFDLLRETARLEVALYYATQGHPASKAATWKAKARGQIVEIDPRRRYTASEVASIFNCSYDTAIRRMRRMPGVRNLGAKEGRFNRGKAMLRILGSDLQAYLDDHKLA
jgi:hypothetical protein